MTLNRNWQRKSTAANWIWKSTVRNSSLDRGQCQLTKAWDNVTDWKLREQAVLRDDTVQTAVFTAGCQQKQSQNWINQAQCEKKKLLNTKPHLNTRVWLTLQTQMIWHEHQSRIGIRRLQLKSWKTPWQWELIQSQQKCYKHLTLSSQWNWWSRSVNSGKRDPPKRWKHGIIGTISKTGNLTVASAPHFYKYL